jgi:hypothetical protein
VHFPTGLSLLVLSVSTFMRIQTRSLKCIDIATRLLVAAHCSSYADDHWTTMDKFGANFQHFNTKIPSFFSYVSAQ